MCISALISLFALWRRNAAMGFAVVSIIAMGAVITSLDYEWRHFRHMRWLIFPLAIAGPFIVAHKIFAIIGPRAAERAFAWLNRVPVGAASPVLLRLTVMGLGVYLAALGAAALIQSQRTNALRAELMSLPTDSLKSQLTSLPSGAKLVAFPDQQAPFLARLDFDLAGCGKHRMNFIYRYRGKVDPTLGKKAIVRMVRSDEEAEHYFFTVHDDIFTAFDGIEMNVGDAKCLVGAYRAGPLAEPFLYHMLIDGRWRPLGSFRF